MKTWKDSNLTVTSKPFDRDLCCFDICVDGSYMQTVCPSSEKDMADAIQQLEVDGAGAVEHWYDGNGDPVAVHFNYHAGRYEVD